MAISKDKKKLILADLKGRFSQAPALVFVDFRGLTANQMLTLRRRLLPVGAKITVAKNTLIKKALGEAADYQDLIKNTDFSGQTAILEPTGDPLLAIKKLFEFIREAELPEVKFALWEGRQLGAAEVKELALIPSQEVLLARVVGGIKAPLTGLAATLGGVARQFTHLLKAISQQKS